MATPATYSWALQNQHQGAAQTATRVRTVSLGDGYEQVAEDGINTHRVTYTLQHIGSATEVDAIKAFLEAGTTAAFYFTPPQGAQGLYRVTPDSISRTMISTTTARIDATLRQCFGVGMRMA